MELLGWIVGAMALSCGLSAGWLLWGRELDRQRLHYRHLLDETRSNWELTETRLAATCEELRAAQVALARPTNGVYAPRQQSPDGLHLPDAQPERRGRGIDPPRPWLRKNRREAVLSR